MGGPIVRTGTTPLFWQNYDRIFSKSGATKSTSAKQATKAKAKTAKKSAKATKKVAGKKKKK